MKANFAAKLIIFSFVLGCKPGSDLSMDDSDKSCDSTSLALHNSDDFALSNTPITFYKDIYPIITSQKSGEVYKCVTCHASYIEPTGLTSVAEIEAVVAAMRSGSMPISGDIVKEEYIQTFLEWRLTGFTIGDPSQIPVEEVDPSVYTPQKKC